MADPVPAVKTDAKTWSQVYPGRFIHGEDIAGKFVLLTVKRFYCEELIDEHDKKGDKFILSFKETERELVLNKTNVVLLKKMFASPEETVGKRVQFITLNDYDPNKRAYAPCIRIGGSPDIEKAISITIKWPRKSAVTYELKKLVPKKAGENEVAQ